MTRSGCCLHRAVTDESGAKAIAGLVLVGVSKKANMKIHAARDAKKQLVQRYLNDRYDPAKRKTSQKRLLDNSSKESY